MKGSIYNNEGNIENLINYRGQLNGHLDMVGLSVYHASPDGCLVD